MSEIEKQRAQKEALDAVASRPPTAGEPRTQAAMRRYLGSSVWRALRHGASAGQPEDTGSEHHQPPRPT
jgi:hypothetical protein